MNTTQTPRMKRRTLVQVGLIEHLRSYINGLRRERLPAVVTPDDFEDFWQEYRHLAPSVIDSRQDFRLNFWRPALHATLSLV